MREKDLFAGVLLVFAATSACARVSSSPSTPPPPNAQRSPSAAHAVGRAGASHKHVDSPADTSGPVIGEYRVAYDGKGELTVDAQFATSPGELFNVESGAEAFVKDLRASGPPSSESATTTRDRSFVIPACAKSGCSIHYRYLLREASKKLNDLDTASEEGSVIESPPSTWLLAPSNADGNHRLRFRVSTPDASTTFVTGVFRARATSDLAWEIAMGDLWTAPYSAFGPLRVKELKAAGKSDGSVSVAKIQLAIAPGKLSLTDDEVVAWVNDASKSIVTYFDRFPIPEALIIVVPGRGGWVGEGKTLSGGGGAIFIRVGEKATPRALRQDWVLVHEMTHLTFPSVARENDWAEEGLATYVEPFARARAGTMSVSDAWHGLVEGLPQGLPAAGDKGLDRTPTWGRTYWGGALFYLLADVDIRKRTNNKMGLEHALRGILAAGGNNAQRWSLDEAFGAGDKALGVPALKELHDVMGTSPHPVDLDKLWRELGVVRDANGKIRFDDSAPLAHIRRAMTTP